MNLTVLKVLQLLFASACSVWALHIINIFSFIPYLSAEHAFDIGITTYFTFFNIICDCIVNRAQNCMCSKLIVTLYANDDGESIENSPHIRFRKDGLAEAYLKVQVFGKKVHFKGAQLMLPAYRCITMQPGKKMHGVDCDNEGNIIVNLDTIFSNGKEKADNKIIVPISFAKEPDSGERSIELIPELRKASAITPFRIRYIHNNMILIIKE